ncbi:pimeloyl-ACP methyl ester carboxylesterase [Actinoplanes octamycinicus]|uniref:Pimeloyl-ACP methyl ester carboxylesterase n=1 Tax=Actinoplanes octamycinicus TaxID=135948 RepID=A0A7W7M7V3_9ACTN|nr:alpha/beta hydrolase [Actinoplanes octamycinicus]MBB4740205.1 pimeloyl-ACP methyl ester carboxylesterase [Actinoplanes octamycinicus]GIE59601.1 hydrolase [Actinoplanes octamycinicus]
MTDLFVEEFGSGPLLGYSHGVFFSPRVEDRLGLLDWSRITGARRIRRYHQRGHGLSPGAPDPELYTWSSLAGDLLAVAGEGPVDWAGSSMGTGTLLWAAARKPDRFRRLVLMIPPTVRDGRVASRQAYLSGAAGVEARSKDAWMTIMRGFPPAPIFADVPGWEFDADVPEPLLPSVLRGAARTDLPGDEALRAVTHPVLILAWETDPGHPVDSAELLAKVLPDARLHVSATSADVRTWPDRIGDFLS